MENKSAKQLAEDAITFIGFDENGDTVRNYIFAEEQFRAFIDQLCKEQREICWDRYMQTDDDDDTVTGNSILNAKQPEV